MSLHMPSFRLVFSQILILSNNSSLQHKNKNQQSRVKENPEIGKFIVTYMLTILWFPAWKSITIEISSLNFFIQIYFIFTQLAFLQSFLVIDLLFLLSLTLNYELYFMKYKPVYALEIRGSPGYCKNACFISNTVPQCSCQIKCGTLI